MRLRQLCPLPLVLSAVLLSSGCGSGHATTVKHTHAKRTSGVSAADTACRHRWQRLEDMLPAQAAQNSSSSQDSAVTQVFASRWSSISSGIAYHVSSGTSADCGKVLSTTREQVQRLDELTSSLSPYDVDARVADASVAAKRWQAKHSKQKDASTRKGIRKTLKTLHQLEHKAAAAVLPALQQLAGIDPTDRKRVKKAMGDLNLLASTSSPFKSYRSEMASLEQQGVKVRSMQPPKPGKGH